MKNTRRLDNEKFVELAKAVHGDKYIYHNVDYVNNKTKVKVVCPEHGYFYIRPDNHLAGKGCPVCSSGPRKTLQDYVDVIKEKYPLLELSKNQDFNRPVSSRNRKFPIKFKCPKHGDFSVSIRSIKENKNIECPECHLERTNQLAIAKRYNNSVSMRDIVYKHFGNKYEIVDVAYNDKYAILRCPKHGNFTFKRSHSYNGPGCPKCRNVTLTISLEDLQKRLHDLYGDEFIFNYRDFNGSYSDKIYVKCKIHGTAIKTVRNLLLGVSCTKCHPVDVNSLPKYTQEEAIAIIKGIYGDKYDCSKFKYANSNTKSTLICPIHGEFQLSMHGITKGHGCPQCGRLSHADKTKYTFEQAKEEANKRFNGLYKYTDLVYEPYKRYDGSIINVPIISYICPNGHHNRQRLRNHLAGYGCKECYESNGVKSIIAFLDKHNLKYHREATIVNTSYRLDFYIRQLNVAIEFNGTQHYKEPTFKGDIDGSLHKTQVNDEIKKGILDAYSTPYIIVKYDVKNIEDYITDKLFEAYKYYKDGILYRNIVEFTKYANVKYKNSQDLEIYKTRNLKVFPFTAKSVNEFPLIAGTPLELVNTKNG